MRGLMAAVIAMGVLIVAGVIALGVVVARRAGGPGPAVAAVLDEPAGTRIAGTAADGPDRLAVQLQGGGPDRVVVLDLRSGQPVARVGLAR